MNIPKLVAHRGFAAKYPENSMSAFRSAIDLGCKYLELDVQLTADYIPIVIHDEDLLRTGGELINVLTSDWRILEGKTVGESERFDDKFKNEKLLQLSQFAALLKENPDVYAFVEIKEECVEKFGEKVVVEAVMESISKVKSQCAIISFDPSVLFYLQKHDDIPIGFVMHKYDDEHRAIAIQMKPDFLICNYQKIPDEDGSLWEGEWQWFLYEIVEAHIALKWYQRGVEYIETMELESMINALTEN